MRMASQNSKRWIDVVAAPVERFQCPLGASLPSVAYRFMLAQADDDFGIVSCCRRARHDLFRFGNAQRYWTKMR